MQKNIPKLKKQSDADFSSVTDLAPTASDCLNDWQLSTNDRRKLNVFCETRKSLGM